MIDRQTKDRISWWVVKARQQGDPFIKFILYWFCFNAWITNLSKKDRDSEAIDWFIKNDSCLKNITKDFWQSTETQAILKNLKNLSPVYDMRPSRKNREVKLEDIDNIGQILRFVYQIRCNLFHGSKNPIDSRDANLVELSSKLLEKWIEWANLKC